MPLVSEMQHPRSLSFAAQRQVVLLRDTQHLAFAAIAARVRNLVGERPSKNLVREVYRDFARPTGHVQYNYRKCGRGRVKVTKTVTQHLEQLLLRQRRQGPCESDVLRRELLREKGVDLAASTIRKALRQLGYFWLPRSQKRLYSAYDMQRRRDFAAAALRLSPARLREKLAFAMDGVVLSMPPEDATGRANFCKGGGSHMWRKHGEAALPALAGHLGYEKQVPLSRAVPMWGGLSYGGFAIVLFHPQEKLRAEHWAQAVDRGDLARAIQSLRPARAHGPWRVLCDNERFLTSHDSRAAYRRAKITLWQIPPRSPDLNPVERFWAWLRKALRAKDLADLKAGKPPLTKAAFQARVRGICRSARAQRVAKNLATLFRKVCVEVVDKHGAASRL